MLSNVCLQCKNIYCTFRHVGFNKGPKVTLETSERTPCLSVDSGEVCKWCELCLFGGGEVASTKREAQAQILDMLRPDSQTLA